MAPRAGHNRATAAPWHPNLRPRRQGPGREGVRRSSVGLGRLAEVAVTEVRFHRNLSFDYDVDDSPTCIVASFTETSIDDGRGAWVELEASIGWERADGPFELEVTVRGVFDWDALRQPTTASSAGWSATASTSFGRTSELRSRG
jgi:hypothetical protein